ncbi:MAG: pantoate--beta-alanine ligase [Cyclobacteriaceae bacterium]|nr:pantoate--beta-alanine ligase [Cyclobacteriaceae bacterium]
MLVIHDPDHLKAEIRSLKVAGNKIGFVPTMGFLHDGHLALVQEALTENNWVVVSIFVNPLQFNNPEDFLLYPHDLPADLEKLKKAGVHMVFVPSKEAMYTEKPTATLSFGTLESTMEGKYRPGHFQGVGVVVAKLFNMVSPDMAYFGLKDLQQFLIIRALVRDLSFQIEVKGMPTVREKTGLALSSRNARLSEAGRQQAAAIFQGLKIAEKEIMERRPPIDVVKGLQHFYQQNPGLRVEYAELVSAETLLSVTSYEVSGYVALCVAVYVEGVRLIDNLYLRL